MILLFKFVRDLNFLIIMI